MLNILDLFEVVVNTFFLIVLMFLSTRVDTCQNLIHMHCANMCWIRACINAFQQHLKEALSTNYG